ncbi:C163A protein, partial [Notiomystis cincta]|nr:C163A protein [Notiomystis cincta]
ELRLAGGGERCAGRVEVKHRGEWGSVCVFEFDWEARWAIVVCRQLGCGQVARASSYAPFGQGTGRIWLQPFFCRGPEDALEECPHFGWGRHFCGHERDVGVTCTGERTLAVLGQPLLARRIPSRPELCRCPAADAVELRLAGGSHPCAGRVEVKLQGRWGSVGDDNWYMEDAEVVCQQLNCGSAAGAYSALDRFGAGEGPVSLALVDCSGDEAVLWDCEIRGWGPYNTSHDFDTAVVCQGFFRLVGGFGDCAGQLEVRQGRAWFGVCEDQVDMKVAQVVCRELGCGAALAIPGSGRFGAGSGPLWNGSFQCNGTEPLLSACAQHLPHGQRCTYPASVICSPYTGFRLGNSSSGCTGRVEVAVRGTWGSVCATEWDLPDAHVLCRHLGCGHAFTVLPGGSFGSGDGPLRPDAFGCSGRERHPGECPVAVLGKPPCTPGNAAAVNCSGVYGAYNYFKMYMVTTAPAGIHHGAAIVCSGGRWVRLVGSSGRCAGRVEVYSDGMWSTVCQEGWELQDAAVVCRELGCGTALEAPSSAHFSPGTGPLWPYIPNCSGTEESLWECGRSERGECGSGGRAGAVCSEQLFVRLAGGRRRCRGYLEVSHNGTWGRVCTNGTSSATAAAVCRQLGCGHWGSLSAVPAQQRASAWLAWVGCEDGANSLWGCPSTPW